MFRGTYTALVTPFQNDEIDVEAFEHLIETQIGGGIDGIVPVGTTGESPTLSCGERHHVTELAVERANGRCQVIAGTGSNSTREAIAHTKAAEEMGADAALLVAPYYNKPSQEGLFRHFASIAEATSLKLVLYNIPGRCAVDIAADTVVRLAENCDNIVSIKEASGSVDRVSELRSRLPDDFTILSGDDSLTLPFLSVGAVGVVSVVSNLFPMEVCRLVRLFLEGNVEEARQLHRKFFPLFKDMFLEPNPVPVKTALAWRGAMSKEVRLPLVELTEANSARLRDTLDALTRDNE
jgi:4-hydroxy-tetrahydrodipicolinate synthase